MICRENELARIVVDRAIEVHRTLGGPGLLEVVYEESMVYELRDRGLHVDRQSPVPITYKGNRLGTPLRPDLVIENLLIVEIKAVSEYNLLFSAQMLTYLRLTTLRLGLVINFGERYVRDGIHRIVNGLAD